MTLMGSLAGPAKPGFRPDIQGLRMIAMKLVPVWEEIGPLVE